MATGRSPRLTSFGCLERDLFHKTSSILTTACEIHGLHHSPDGLLPSDPPQDLVSIPHQLTGNWAMEGRNGNAHDPAIWSLVVAHMRHQTFCFSHSTLAPGQVWSECQKMTCMAPGRSFVCSLVRSSSSKIFYQ